jgi:hypothetical protein
MKTSNKILLVSFGVVLLSIAILAFTVGRVFRIPDHYESTGNATEVMNAAPFTEIEVQGKFRIHYTQGTVKKVVIKTDSSLLKLVVSDISNGTLHLRTSEPITSRQHIDVEVSTDSITRASIHAGGIFQTEKKMKVHQFTGEGSAGAIYKVEGDFVNLTLEFSAGVVGDFSGKCDFLDVSSSAGTVLNSSDLVARNGNVSSSAGSVNNIYVTDKLDIHASAGSIVRCKGNPKTKNVDVSSGARFIN